MPRNLKEKLALILDDAETLPRCEAIRLLERLINEELQFKELEHSIDTYDLSVVRSNAIQKYTNMALNSEALGRIKGDSEYIRTKCFVEATIELLRNKGLIAFTLAFNGKK